MGSPIRLMPTLLLCTETFDSQARAMASAATRAGAAVRLVISGGAGQDEPTDAEAIRASFDRDGEAVTAVLAALDGIVIDGVLATGDGPAWMAAHVALARGLPWHQPDAVDAATHGLKARGRWLAAGLPVPWFVALPASGDDDLDRLTRVRVPCVVRSVTSAVRGEAISVDSYATLLAARGRIGERLARSARLAWRADGDAAVIVEGRVPGQAYALDGVLEQGALRVFALFEVLDGPDVPAPDAAVLVTPARLAPARQHVIAGHMARAALALGLHHGPVHVRGRADGDDIVVLDVAPRALEGPRMRVIPVVAPGGARVGLEDVLVAHALGRPLEGYGHQGLARGVLTVGPQSGADVDLASVRALPGVVDVEGGARTYVFAEGAQPDDVVATLRQAAARLARSVRAQPASVETTSKG